MTLQGLTMALFLLLTLLAPQRCWLLLTSPAPQCTLLMLLYQFQVWNSVSHLFTVLHLATISVHAYNYLILVSLYSLDFCQFTELVWSHFEHNTLVALDWIPSLSYACPTELLMASTACACGCVPVSLFCYPN
jgi:hypothetical protein